MKIFEVLTENKSEFLKFIGDTNAGMALGKLIHSNARVNSDQMPTPVKVSSTIKFLQGPKWYQQMFKNNRVYILQGSSGWAAIYRPKDMGYVTRAQVELAISNDQGTRIDSDIINTVNQAGEGSLTGMLEKEIGTIQKSFWIGNHPYSRMSSDELKRLQRTSQSRYNRPNITNTFNPPIGYNNIASERVKSLVPTMVIDIKRELRQAVRRGQLEPLPDISMEDLFDSLDEFAEDKVSYIGRINKALGGLSLLSVWVDSVERALKKLKLHTYSKNLNPRDVVEVFKNAKARFRKEVIKSFFTTV